MDGDSKVVSRHGLLSQFEPWIDPTNNEDPPIVLIGAGLSFGLVPVADKLAREVDERKDSIEAALGITSGVSPTNAATLYEWADDCIRQSLGQGLSEPEAKKRLADAIGLTSDARFLAQANIPLRGTTDRHRVLSRLAREGRVEALWSFNWDCWLEASLECVGLRRGERSGRIAPGDWKLRYHVWVDSVRDAENSDTVPVFKAHGCVQALHDNRGDFVIAKSEMERALVEQPIARSSRMAREVAAPWMVALGWSGTEGYVKELLANLGSGGLLGKRLTIVDINPEQNGHLEVCDSYRCDIADAAVKVSCETPGTTDDLFLWIQTRRGLSALVEACSGDADLVAALAATRDSLPSFDSPGLSKLWCVSYLDDWLPIWLRTCFMVGAQNHSTKPGAEEEILPTEQRDAHVPWACNLYSRADLKVAARLLLMLQRAEASSCEYDFETFPGAIWNRRDQVLVLPVPIWAQMDKISGVSLKPLVESHHWSERGRIRALKLLPMDSSEVKISVAVRAERVMRWKEAIASVFGHAHLAVPENIGEVELEDLLVTESEAE